VPFDERPGLIPNEGGRVVGDDGICPGEYVVGWIKRGPSGVIGTNKKDAADTVARIVEDAEAGTLGDAEGGPEAGTLGDAEGDPEAAEAIQAWLGEQVPNHVTWDGWEAIDAYESSLGEPSGRPRVKLVRVDDLFRASRR